MTDTSPQLDQLRLEQLYVKLEGSMLNVVYRWLWDADEAQDVVQDAFVRVWKMRDRVDVHTVEPLLYKVAINLANNRRRRRKIWRWVSLDVLFEQRSPSRDAEEEISAHEQREAVRRAVEALPDKLRSVVMLCEFSELTYNEVGAVLSIPPGTVASRRHSALERIRRSFGPTRTNVDKHDRQ